MCSWSYLVVFQIELLVDVVDCCEDIEESEAEEEFGVPIPPVLLLPLPPLPLWAFWFVKNQLVLTGQNPDCPLLGSLPLWLFMVYFLKWIYLFLCKIFVLSNNMSGLKRDKCCVLSLQLTTDDVGKKTWGIYRLGVCVAHVFWWNVFSVPAFSLCSKTCSSLCFKFMLLGGWEESGMQ